MILYSTDENGCDAELACHPGHIGMKPLKIIRAYLYCIRSKYQMPEIPVKTMSIYYTRFFSHRCSAEDTKVACALKAHAFPSYFM